MTSRQANVFTTLFALLTLAAAAYGIWRFKDLRDEVMRQKASLAEIQSAILFAEGATYGLQDLNARLRGLCGQRPQSDQVRGFCDRQLPSMDALQLLAQARQARIAAAQSSDYTRARQGYETLVRYLQSRPDDGWKRGWLALAMEGIAYADLKLNRLDEASAAIAKAAHLSPEDASVGATALKIRCVQDAPADEVASAFRGLTDRLDKGIAATRPDEERGRNLRLERQFLDRDEELFHLCDYAKLRSRA